jgi:fimbrial chaperone protein
MAIAVIMAPMASGSGLQVTPIGLRLATKTSAEALWLTNTGSDTIQAQVRVFRWTQVNGEDVLAPSRDLVASPPMVAIAPGDRQLVRVIRQVTPPEGGVEGAYRILVDELPVGVDVKGGLTFVLRYSIPVFLAPAGDPPTKAALETAWEETAAGTRLQVHNHGNGHAQIADVAWQGPGERRSVLLSGLVGYALPGSTMRWNLPGGLPSGGVLRARINGDTSESTLVTTPRGP